ncbi:MAG: hypothetical protein A2V62_06875 [Nitrospirae bacterium RBG_19FT_COMBO_58_9]|nr:MAG: hypothetical protein A2V62_06875 [Nitrospirae bacterium RBG_19FT_COMBO_58_9]
MSGGLFRSLLRRLHLPAIPLGDTLEVVGQDRSTLVVNIRIDGCGKNDLRVQEATHREEQDSKHEGHSSDQANMPSLRSGIHLISDCIHRHKYIDWNDRSHLID